MKLGLSISLLGAALQWGLIKVIGMHVCSLFLPMPMIYFGLPLVYANAAALGLSNCRNKSMASGIFTLLNVGLSLLGVLLMGWIGVHSLLNVSLLFVAICSVMAFLFFLSSRAERSSLSFESPNESWGFFQLVFQPSRRFCTFCVFACVFVGGDMASRALFRWTG